MDIQTDAFTRGIGGSPSLLACKWPELEALPAEVVAAAEAIKAQGAKSGNDLVSKVFAEGAWIACTVHLTLQQVSCKAAFLQHLNVQVWTETLLLLQAGLPVQHPVTAEFEQACGQLLEGQGEAPILDMCQQVREAILMPWHVAPDVRRVQVPSAPNLGGACAAAAVRELFHSLCMRGTMSDERREFLRVACAALGSPPDADVPRLAARMDAMVAAAGTSTQAVALWDFLAFCAVFSTSVPLVAHVLTVTSEVALTLGATQPQLGQAWERWSPALTAALSGGLNMLQYLSGSAVAHPACEQGMLIPEQWVRAAPQDAHDALRGAMATNCADIVNLLSLGGEGEGEPTKPRPLIAGGLDAAFVVGCACGSVDALAALLDCPRHTPYHMNHWHVQAGMGAAGACLSLDLVQLFAKHLPVQDQAWRALLSAAASSAPLHVVQAAEQAVTGIQFQHAGPGKGVVGPIMTGMLIAAVQGGQLPTVEYLLAKRGRQSVPWLQHIRSYITTASVLGNAAMLQFWLDKLGDFFAAIVDVSDAADLVRNAKGPCKRQLHEATLAAFGEAPSLDEANPDELLVPQWLLDLPECRPSDPAAVDAAVKHTQVFLQHRSMPARTLYQASPIKEFACFAMAVHAVQYVASHAPWLIAMPDAMQSICEWVTAYRGSPLGFGLPLPRLALFIGWTPLRRLAAAAGLPIPHGRRDQAGDWFCGLPPLFDEHEVSGDVLRESLANLLPPPWQPAENYTYYKGAQGFAQSEQMLLAAPLLAGALVADGRFAGEMKAALHGVAAQGGGEVEEAPISGAMRQALRTSNSLRRRSMVLLRAAV